MSEERHWLEKLTVSLDDHKLGVQYGAYSIAIVGLAVALRSVRPFKSFVNPQDIPASFIKSQMKLSGRVLRIEPSSGSTPTALIVHHYPVISFPRSPTSGLPVQIASVDISSNGISWLQHVVIGKDINFTLLKANPNFATCVVDHQKRNIGADLVSLGFASVSAIEFKLEKDPKYLSYYKGLLAAENKAERKGVGMWAGEATNYIIISKMLSKFIQLSKDIIQKTKRRVATKPTQLVKVM